ncbi:MAG: amidohydrolase family protein [Bacteroidota bacterium]
MRIDTHNHFWEYDPIRDSWIDDSMGAIRRDFLPQDLFPILHKSKVDACITVQANQSEKETTFLLELAEENSFIKGVVGWVDLLADNVEERLAFFSEQPKLKGIRHILQAEPNDFVLRKDFQNGIAHLNKFKLVYDILIYPSQIANSINLVEKFPDQTFVLDHVAKPDIRNNQILHWKKDIEILASYPNVFCKVSGLVTEASWNNWKYEDFKPYLDVVFEAFGVERIMFGSDWPVCLLAAKYDEVIGIVERYILQLSKEEKNKVMGLNAMKVYGI